MTNGTKGRFNRVAGTNTLPMRGRELIKSHQPPHGLSASRSSPWGISPHRSIDKQIKRRSASAFVSACQMHARPALLLAALISVGSSGYSSSCASSSVVGEYQDRFHPVPTRNPWHHRQWLTGARSCRGISASVILHASSGRFPYPIFYRQKVFLSAFIHTNDDQCTEFYMLCPEATVDPIRPHIDPLLFV